MIISPFDRPWDSQPQDVVGLSGAHPLAGKVAGFWLPHGYNAKNGRPATQITAPRRASRYGTALTFNDGSEIAQFDSLQVTDTYFSAITLLTMGASSASGERQGIWHFQASVGSVQARLRLIWLPGSGFYLDSDGGFAFTTNPTFSAGDSFVLGVTRGASGANCQFYLNGLPISTSSPTPGAGGIPTSAVPLWLGDDVEATSGWRLIGSIAGHVHFNAQLTAAEMHSASSAVWALLSPRRLWIPGATAGAAPSYVRPPFASPVFASPVIRSANAWH